MLDLTIYRILSNQENSCPIERHVCTLRNNYPSFVYWDSLSEKEKIIIRLQKRHRVYRRCACLWCGYVLRPEDSKTGKTRNFCNTYCNRKYLIFLDKLESDENPLRINIRIFKEYCLIRMIFRDPAMRLDEQFRKVCKWKEPIPIIPTQKPHTKKG